MIPRIAIPVPTSRDLEYNRRSWPKYADAVRRSGGEAVRVELLVKDVRSLLQSCHGVLLPGSPADVRPGRYGQAVEPLTATGDLSREECDDRLLEGAERDGKPLLGICFGLQSLNVWRGGSLLQHVMPLPVNHAAGPEVAIAHPILIAKDSLLGSLVDRKEATEEARFLRLPINTSHHQAASTPGDGLRVVARSPEDGVIEALESENSLHDDGSQFVLGVQWHPERSFDISATSRALFGKLMREAVLWSERHLGLAAR